MTTGLAIAISLACVGWTVALLLGALLWIMALGAAATAGKAGK